MKKLFLLLFLLTHVLGSEINSISASNLMSQTTKKREVPVKNTTGVPIFRSPTYSPVQVSVCGNLLIINFQESFEVLVQIENLETNETILLNSYDTQIDTVVNIGIYDKGMYKISFSSDVYEGWGEFLINE